MLIATVGVLAGQSDAPQAKGGLSPKDSLRSFTVAADLELDQVLSEPEISQPVFVNFDERGRLWVVEYRQYPSPAGLKVVSRDKYWRVVYDKVPQAPPNHVRGKDRITIHEDTRGTGVFDKHTVFVDGLNITTAAVRGRGGVWVLNPPYLLFYPTKDGGDVPAGDPEVRLEGFGLEDTHSVVNSLCWGPDGWLYAAQGSTVSGNVRRPGDKTAVTSLGQCIWRYQPETRRYEIFAEGGGNAFGVEIDQKGRIFSGHNGGNTRGFDYVQGGYYLKGFEKHGELSNPYAFGYFPAMQHAAVERFSHTFVINEGGALPEPYRGKLFAPTPLQSQVVFSEIVPNGSSWRTRDLGKILTTTDTWFRPVDIKLGPDGNIYIADWYDSTISHLKNNDGQVDPDKGRVYRLRAKGMQASTRVDLGKLSTDELIGLLSHENRWMRQTALRLIGDRKDRSVIAKLERLVAERQGQPALEALWALNQSGGFTESIALETLGHTDPYVRLWTVRLLGDERHVPVKIAERLAKLATDEGNVEVRSQLASSARRLPPRDGLPIVRRLLAHNEDVKDPHLPLLLWWAIEANAESGRAEIVQMFEDPALWRLPLVEKHILERLMRRYAQAGRQKDLLTCAELLRLAPAKEHVKELLTGFEKAFAGRAIANLPRELTDALAARGGGSLALRLRQGDAGAIDTALQTIADTAAREAERLQLIQIMGEVSQPRAVAALLGVLDDAAHPKVREAALHALQVYADARVGTEVVKRYADLPPDLRSAAQALLASRASWTMELLQAVDAGKIDKTTIAPEAVRKLLLHSSDKIQGLVHKHWGEIKGATTAQMRQEIDRLVKVVGAGKGDPYDGKKLFDASCSKCHRLFGKGGDIGPDLTPYKRDDLDNLMLQIVNPSAEIREGYENHFILTTDGRALNGFLLERDDKIVVLRGSDGQTTAIKRDQIDDMKVIPQSLMPEGLLTGMTDQQVRDLFAYLRSGQPLNLKE
jgi:putative membrane-bound dehydrogenase-like protein